MRHRTEGIEQRLSAAGRNRRIFSYIQHRKHVSLNVPSQSPLLLISALVIDHVTTLYCLILHDVSELYQWSLCVGVDDIVSGSDG